MGRLPEKIQQIYWTTPFADALHTLTARYVFGSGIDEPLAAIAEHDRSFIKDVTPCKEKEFIQKAMENINCPSCGSKYWVATYSGFFSYPHYHAELGKLPLWKDGEYQFRVKGVPPEHLDLAVQVLDANYDNTAELTSLSTSISISISDASGHVLCSVDGKLSDATRRDLNSWVLASSPIYAAFWHRNRQQLSIS